MKRRSVPQICEPEHTSTAIEKEAAEKSGLAQRLADASRSLHALSAEIGALGALPSADLLPEKPPKSSRIISTLELAARAQRVYQSRRKRAQIFDDEKLFGEPAWDILLDLFIAACHEKRVAVTSACIGAYVPNTTALRWLNVLELKGLIFRESDEQDGRRTYVALSELGFKRMSEYFSQPN